MDGGGGAPRWHPGRLHGCPEGTARPPCRRRVQRGVSSHRQAPRVPRELTLPAGRGPSPWVSPERVQCTPVEGPGPNLPRKWWPSDLASLLQTSPLSPPPGHRPLVLGPATELRPARPHASTASLHRQPPHPLRPRRARSGGSPLPLPAAKALSPSPGGQRSRIFPSGPHRRPDDEAISAFTRLKGPAWWSPHGDEAVACAGTCSVIRFILIFFPDVPRDLIKYRRGDLSSVRLNDLPHILWPAG